MTVCTGNICRSPMAEIVLRDRFSAAGLGDLVVVDSSGVSDEERGNPVDRRARAVLAAHGYPTGDGHRAHRITPDELATRALVLAMTAQHARVLRRLAGGAAPQVLLYRSFDPAAPALAPGAREDVLDIADPWYGGPDDFELCLSQLEAAADAIVTHTRPHLPHP
ncbi:low molecular weight protein-tyrosine-phosphatase [Cellulomonas composti]|nr:low molecular weight protein-tyrosine-phosphatase [Cellulomonas composti]